MHGLWPPFWLRLDLRVGLGFQLGLGANVPAQHERHRVDPEHLEPVPYEQEDEKVEPAGAVAAQQHRADRGGVEAERREAASERDLADPTTTVGADQDDARRRVPEQPGCALAPVAGEVRQRLDLLLRSGGCPYVVCQAAVGSCAVGWGL